VNLRGKLLRLYVRAVFTDMREILTRPKFIPFNQKIYARVIYASTSADNQLTRPGTTLTFPSKYFFENSRHFLTEKKPDVLIQKTYISGTNSTANNITDRFLKCKYFQARLYFVSKQRLTFLFASTDRTPCVRISRRTNRYASSGKRIDFGNVMKANRPRDTIAGRIFFAAKRYNTRTDVFARNVLERKLEIFSVPVNGPPNARSPRRSTTRSIDIISRVTFSSRSKIE